MIIALWINAGFLILGALAAIAIVGKPREPVTGGQAVLAVIIAGSQAGIVIAAALTLARR